MAPGPGSSSLSGKARCEEKYIRRPLGSKVTPVSSERSCCGPVTERKRDTRRSRSITPMSISSVAMSSQTKISPAREPVIWSTRSSGALLVASPS